MTQNQEMIQLLMDEGEYAPMYPFVLKSNLSDFQKLLVSQMLNDIRMNGTITWKHETYANKLNASRIGIWKQFKLLTESGILIPSIENKAGSKNNKFIISFDAIRSYVKPVNPGNKSIDEEPVNGEQEPVNQENMSNNTNLLTESNKPVNGEQEPVNGEQEPVNGEKKPVNPGVHIKKVKERTKESNKERIKIVEEDSFFDDMDLEQRFNFKVKEEETVIKKEIDKDDLDQFLLELESQF